eukprot:CAMPEP_0181184656 /NCGR_PEP_ID=MMETSP1096-20121128/9085_1 /TAXON_ID=156174 ORGANISM="Chrysochromulina ericina, Strain CCMP281" /NCGR_SAMPLE_ID=MMETSP1096 /ASSEMBLY_ACC=CAM_ASM_000453 /LENGTH=98 /DNA_ID=CAMNT_0023273437 /DNA_START=50 /DNA_END=346 /DNA_ORIENTATION=-
MARFVLVALIVAAAHGFVVPAPQLASQLTTTRAIPTMPSTEGIQMMAKSNKTPKQGTRGSADVVELLGDISGELFKGNSGALFLLWALIVANLLGVFS